LKIVFRDRGIRTIGDLSALSEAEVESLPVRSPKSTNTVKCLEEFKKLLTTRRERKLSTGDTTSNETNNELVSAGNSPKQEGNLLNGSSVSNDETCTSIDVETIEGETSSILVNDSCFQEPTSIQNKISIDEITIEDESSRKLCDLISKDDSALSSFIEGLADQAKLKLFKGLTNVIPYQDLIDSFHQYLTKQKLNVVNNQK